MKRRSKEEELITVDDLYRNSYEDDRFHLDSQQVLIMLGGLVAGIIIGLIERVLFG